MYRAWWELPKFLFLSINIGMTKLMMGWAGHLVRMGAVWSTPFCSEASKGREHFGGLNCVIDGNIKMELN